LAVLSFESKNLCVVIIKIRHLFNNRKEQKGFTKSLKSHFTIFPSSIDVWFRFSNPKKNEAFQRYSGIVTPDTFFIFPRKEQQFRSKNKLRKNKGLPS
jgi:hypothetical protein